MLAKIFNIKNNIAVPTEFSYTIGYLKDIIDEYGDNAGKIFCYLHYMCSMNPNDNPFCNIEEIKKKEVIVRTICPEIDVDNPLIEIALDLIKELYETPTYRIHLAFKKTIDKIANELNYVHISLLKEDGNVGEIQKSLKMYQDLKKEYKESYQELMQEMETEIAINNRERNQWSGKSKELK